MGAAIATLSASAHDEIVLHDERPGELKGGM
jgi:hypothetical protein